MTPPFDEIRDSGAASAAPEVDDAAADVEEAGPRAESEESQPPDPSIPAGEPEAPVTPSTPREEPSQPGEPGGPADPASPGDPASLGDPDGSDEPSSPAAAEQRPAANGEDEQRVEHDLEELTARAQKADEYLELAQRTRADFENYRKRAAREAAAAQERGVVKLVRELLPAVDNLDRAVDAIFANGDGGDELTSGIKLVHAEVIAALARAGVERFSPQGERFDPEQHEAVAQQAVDGAEAGTVVEVYQRGYRLGDSVIRPARVVVGG